MKIFKSQWQWGGNCEGFFMTKSLLDGIFAGEGRNLVNLLKQLKAKSFFFPLSWSRNWTIAGTVLLFRAVGWTASALIGSWNSELTRRKQAKCHGEGSSKILQLTLTAILFFHTRRLFPIPPFFLFFYLFFSSEHETSDSPFSWGAEVKDPLERIKSLTYLVHGSSGKIEADCATKNSP